MIVFKGGGHSVSGAPTGLGKGFSGLAAYLKLGSLDALNPDRVAWVSYRSLDDIDDPSSAAHLMRAHASENPRVERPVYHFGLSLHPGEHLSREQWDQAADQVLRRMGLEGHQAIVVAHRDTDKEHVHIVVNRVGEDGRAWDARRDKVKAREAIRRIEMDFGLMRTGPRDLPVPELTPGAYQQALRTGSQPLADRVREQAATAFAEATSWHNLEERLALHGFRIEPAARGSGLLVSDGRRSASLSHVDRALSGPKLASRFGETFREHRLTHPEPPTVVVPGYAPSPLAGSTIEERAASLVERLTGTRATFTAADFHRAAFHQPESVALVREAVQSPAVLELGRDIHGATRYTTREYLEAEARLLTSASCLASRGHFRLDSNEVNQVLDRVAPHLSDEQRGAVRHATTEADLAQIVGRAGAGKTTAARAIASVYLERGCELRGAALAGKAAAVLETETGIPSRTLASLEQAWSQGRDRLHDHSVLVVDEAGMVDARRLGRVLSYAEERGAKVILLGDPDQLKAIGAGDAFRGLLEQYPSAHIDTIRRQHEPWQRVASEHLAGGRVAAALDSYEGAGRLHWTETRVDARAEILSHYRLDRGQEPVPSQLILAYRNTDVTLLNEAVRAARKAAGELGSGVTVGGTELAAGDRVVFLRNDNHGREVANIDASPALGVRNGTLGTVLSADLHRITVRLDDHRTVAFDPARYSAVAHGYAVTIHKSQGATVDRVYALADPLMNRNAAYVALTRHRDSVHFFADRETFAGRDQLDRALSRDGHKDLASDYGSAELRRAVTRLQDLAAKTAGLAREERPLREALAAFETLREARLHVVDARHSVDGAVRQVYVEPAKALRNLLRDPFAPENLRRGAVDLYGELRGRGRFTSNHERAAAHRAVPSLTGRLESYHRSLAGLQGARLAAGAQRSRRNIGPSSAPHAVPIHLHQPAQRGQLGLRGALRSQAVRPAHIKRELARVVTALRTYQHASRGAQEAIEVAIRGMGHLTVNSALLLLPPSVALPVGLAVRAIERAFDRGVDIGLGR